MYAIVIVCLDVRYNEVNDYDFNTGGVLYGHPSNSMIGHFTQMVWLGSSMVGCSAAVCNYGITNFQPGQFMEQQLAVTCKALASVQLHLLLSSLSSRSELRQQWPGAFSGCGSEP